MFKTIRPVALILIFIAAMGYGADVASALVRQSDGGISIIAQEPYAPRYLPVVSAIEQEMNKLKIPGAAVAIVEGGEITFAVGFGSKHPDGNDPVLPTTLFRIGSVTKTLTAIGLLQCVERRLVNINAPITDYIPELSFARDANWAPSITVKNLLTHTSAIADYLEIDTPEYKDDESLSRFFSGPYGKSPYAYLMAPAGRMFNYTNPGYALAGWVIESVGDSFYRLYIEQNVLTPLDMTRTFFLPEEVIADGDFAYGAALHWETGKPFVVAPNSYDSGWGRPAGFAFSNVLDLANIVKFLRAERPDVLTDKWRLAMQQPQMNTEMFLDLLHCGYGLIIQEAGFYHPTAPSFYRLRIISHDGDVPGFSADVYYVPQLDFGFIALTNASYAHLSTSFATALTTLCIMPAPVTPPNFSMTPADYARYGGQFHDAYNVGDVLVKTSANQLTVEIPVFDQIGLAYNHTLLPATPNNFILYLYGLTLFDALPLPVTFILDDKGSRVYFRTRSFVARYIGEIPPKSGRRRKSAWPESAPSRLLSDWNRYLPEPQLPFITPPPR